MGLDQRRASLLLSFSSIFFFFFFRTTLSRCWNFFNSRNSRESFSRTIAKRSLSFSFVKKKKLPFPGFFHRLLPRHVASPSFVSSSLLPALSPALYVSLYLLPPRLLVIGVDALEGDSCYGLKRMAKFVEVKRGRSCYLFFLFFFLYFSSTLSDRSSV